MKQEQDLPTDRDCGTGVVGAPILVLHTDFTSSA